MHSISDKMKGDTMTVEERQSQLRERLNKFGYFSSIGDECLNALITYVVSKNYDKRADVLAFMNDLTEDQINDLLTRKSITEFILYAIGMGGYAGKFGDPQFVVIKSKDTGVSVLPFSEDWMTPLVGLWEVHITSFGSVTVVSDTEIPYYRVFDYVETILDETADKCDLATIASDYAKATGVGLGSTSPIDWLLYKIIVKAGAMDKVTDVAEISGRLAEYFK